MGDRYGQFVERLKAALFTAPGDTDRAMRSAIEARSATLGGRSDSAAAVARVPTNLERYVDTVARHAYRVTDDDVQARKDAGYSEDALFEITACAAVGAGLGRLERGLLVLREARRA